MTDQTLDFENETTAIVKQEEQGLVEKVPDVQEMIAFAVGNIGPHQVLQIGDNAYFGKAACNYVTKYSGASTQIVSNNYTTDEVYDADGKPHTVICADAIVRVSWPDGTFREEVGGADSSMKFYNRSGRLQPHQIRRSHLMAHAITAATNRCIRSRAGLDGIPAHLIPPSFKNLQKVNFKKV